VKEAIMGHKRILSIIPLVLCVAVALAAQPKKDRPIAFTPFLDEIGEAGKQETKQVFTTAESYRAYFGHNAPDVNFDTHWVAFYSAGNRPKTGHDVAIRAVALTADGRVLKVTTSLLSPGPNCATYPLLTKPYALVKFRRPQQKVADTQFSARDTQRRCSDQTLCDTKRCLPGTNCAFVILFGTQPPYPVRAECIRGENRCERTRCPGDGQCVLNTNGAAICIPPSK
jgi:hypothetical protein